MSDQGEYGDLNLTPTGLKNYIKLLEYLSDPDKDWPGRFKYSTEILGYVKDNAIYNTLTPDTITEIEVKAFANREARCTRHKANIRHAMYKRATGYSHDAVKILKKKVVTTDKAGNVTETVEPMYVPYIKHYPPDRAAAQEWMDRVEGKIKENINHEINPGEGVTIDVVIGGDK